MLRRGYRPDTNARISRWNASWLWIGATGGSGGVRTRHSGFAPRNHVYNGRFICECSCLSRYRLRLEVQLFLAP